MLLPYLSWFGRKVCRLRGLVHQAWIWLHGGSCEGRLYVSPGVMWKHAPHAGIRIGRGVLIGPGCIFDVPSGARLSIGAETKLNAYVYIGSSQEISIGEKTLVAEFVTIRDAEHGIEPGVEIVDQPLRISPVKIGRGAWICRGAAITCGSAMGDGAVLGANAVLRGNIPDGGIAVGIPARVVKMRRLEPDA